MADTTEKNDEAVKTQLQEVEQLLEEGDKRIRMMVNSLPNALAYFADSDGKILYANGLAAEALGATQAEVESSGKTYAELTGADVEVVQTLLGRVAKVLEKNQDMIIPSDTFVGAGGRKKTVRTHISSMGYNGQKAALVISMILDEPPSTESTEETTAKGKAGAEPSGDAEAEGEAEAEAESEGPAAKKARVGEKEGDAEENDGEGKDKEAAAEQ